MKRLEDLCRGETPGSELRELSKIFSYDEDERVWVWPDNPNSSNSNIGSFKRPLLTLECGKARASADDVLIYIPPATSKS